MTPHRDHGRGSLILDRMCGKLGRLKVASGTMDPEEFDALNGMITKLKKDRRWDLLGLLVRPGEDLPAPVTPLELLDAVYRGELAALPSAEELRALRPAIERWLPIADIAETTRTGYEQSLLKLVPEGAKIVELPGLLRDQRVRAIAAGRRPTFNRLLMAARSFAATFGDEHKLCRAVRAILPLEESPREGNPQEPDEIRALAQRFKWADELWALCLTGMRRLEYWGAHRWEVTSDRVKIAGAKGRRGQPLPRVAPLIYRPAAPRVGYSGFYHDLQDATGKTLNVHDLRKTYQRWLEDAGVPDWRIALYAGHAKGRQMLATIYRKPRDLTRLLVEDGELVRTWLGDPPVAGLRVASA